MNVNRKYEVITVVSETISIGKKRGLPKGLKTAIILLLELRERKRERKWKANIFVQQRLYNLQIHGPGHLRKGQFIMGKQCGRVSPSLASSNLMLKLAPGDLRVRWENWHNNIKSTLVQINVWKLFRWVGWQIKISINLGLIILQESWKTTGRYNLPIGETEI